MLNNTICIEIWSSLGNISFIRIYSFIRTYKSSGKHYMRSCLFICWRSCFLLYVGLIDNCDKLRSTNSGVARILVRGWGNSLGGQPRVGSGGGAPRTPENFRKFSKKFFRKSLKMHYFSIFFKKSNKPMRSFFAVWTKNTNCWDILRNFW